MHCSTSSGAMYRCRFLLCTATFVSISWLLVDAAMAETTEASEVAADSTMRAIPDDRYTPIRGGWQLRIHADKFYKDIAVKNAAVTLCGVAAKAIDPDGKRLKPAAPLGYLRDNPRRHFRPLYPPADKSHVWSEAEQARTPRVSFRPVILAGTVPQFVFDYHSAGGILGRLHLGIIRPDGQSRWLHDWPDLTVRYVDGRVEYDFGDREFLPGANILLSASPLADSPGLILKIEILGAPAGTHLVWAYGGASAAFTNKPLNAPEMNYAPAQCANDVYVIDRQGFVLEREFTSADMIAGKPGQSRGIMHVLQDWKARVRGTVSRPGTMVLARPEAFLDSPAALWKSADFDRQQGKGCVIAGKSPVDQPHTTEYIVIGMGNNIDRAIRAPANAWREALARNAGISKRIVTRTPDPHLDAAMTTFAFGNEGLWGSQAYLHGAWSWRSAFLGWRSLYGPMVYGWNERVRKDILNRCQLCVIKKGHDAGGISSGLEWSGIFYNMNEVFFDMVRHYVDYTDDVELLEEVFPVLEGAIARENRRLRPDGGLLYESALNTWISDSHWYIGAQCTQASPYMLRAYEFMADAAQRLGRDAEPFRQQADRIRTAMQRTLWQKRLGVFAECKDTRGNRLLHPEPELPTIYHAAEFGAADPLQISQMLFWADSRLRQEQTPGGGRLYWSSNWYPNRGLSYTHSTYEMAYGEELNFAETNFLAGRSDVGYALLRACLSGIFNGDVPGGLSCHAYVDGRQRSNAEFADSTSMWGRAVTEGLFGIRIKRPKQLVELSPQIPAAWPAAEISTPHFAYRFERKEGSLRIQWTSPVRTALKLRLPLMASAVSKVKVDEQEFPYRLEPGVDLSWLLVETPASTHGAIDVQYTPDDCRRPSRIVARQGESCRAELPGVKAVEVFDPQGLLAEARIENGVLIGKVAAAPGPGLLFLSEKRKDAPCWISVPFDIQPVQRVEKPLWQPLGDKHRSMDSWTLIDLRPVFNCAVPDIPRRVKEGAIPPALPACQVGFNYWLQHVTERSKPPVDAAWRAKIDSAGVAWTVDGIPFRSAKDGPNVAAVCLHNRSFPAALSFPVKTAGKALFLMIGGETWPAQSHVVNLRISLHYADGAIERRDLVQPFDIGQCWSDWCLYFDTPVNGFENLGGRWGPAGTAKAIDRSRPIRVDTIAHLLRFNLPAGRRLDKVELEAVANDVVYGVMGASVLKAD